MRHATEVRNLPNCTVDCVNKCINCCFRYVTNFLYQQNIISLHDLQTEKLEKQIPKTFPTRRGTKIMNVHRVQKKGATDFFAVTFTNIDGFS